MRKDLLFLATAAFALASCSNENMVDLNTEDAIKFRATVGYSTSARGLETMTSNLNAFYVTALEDLYPDDPTCSNYTNLFTDLLFEKKDGYFVSNPPYKFSQKMKLKFYAYGYSSSPNKPAPSNIRESIFGEGVYITADQATIDYFTPQPEIPNQVDLVVATATGDISNALTCVELTFDHILSEVQVVAKCSSKAHQVLVKGVKYGNIKNQGQYDFVRNNWDIKNDASTSYSVKYLSEPINLNSKTYDHSHNPNGNAEPTMLYHDISKSEKAGTGYAMLFPQSLTTWGSSTEYFDKGEDGIFPPGKTQTRAQYIALLCRIEALDKDGNVTAPKFPITEGHQVAGTDGYGWAYIPIHTEKVNKWEMGHRYVYHLDLTDGAGYNEDGEPILEGNIQFTASVNPWTHVEIYKPESNK